MGGAGGAAGGAGGGMGGAGGGFMPPLGTPDYPSETEQNNLKVFANPLQPGTKGFTGAIYPAGDVDIFQIDVTAAGSTLTVAITDGMGGCPPGVATYVRIFNDANGLLGSDTASGPDLCSLLTPAQAAGLANLSVGKYFVQVESAVATSIPFYIVDIKLKPPGCGDGIVQVAAGEQCDDSNTAGGDGCSSLCKLEGNFTTEMESNDTSPKANLLDGFDGVVASISPTGDPDYFSFNVALAGTKVTLEVTNGLKNLNHCPAGFDSKIYLTDAASNPVAVDDDGGDGACSRISPQVYPAAGNLAAGTYYVKVEELGNNAVQPFYVLEIILQAPGCGDSILQAGEQCDDGNTMSGDGCSNTCMLEGTFLAETEPNNNAITANPLGAADGFIAAISPVGDQDYFSFDVSIPGSSVTVETSDGLSGCPAGFDSKIYLYDSNSVQLALDDNSGAGSCSLISPLLYPAAIGLPMGNYYVRVEQANNNMTQATYVTKIKVLAPGCGDALLQAGEQCDDGNTMSGDGCSSACQAEPPFESEPNNTTATADPLWPGTMQWRGSILPKGDHDYFTFTLAAPGSPMLVTHDAGSPATCAFDTMIHLLDSNGMQIIYDDDLGPGSCSMIDKANYPMVNNLPAGTYYVWVQKYQDDVTIPLYQLDLTIQ
jgi:cysteine-rich repeat protein